MDHDIKYLYAFGSAITDQFDLTNSDIDLLIELDHTDPLKKRETLLKLWDEFEAFFHRKVDLLTERSIKNPILKQSIDNSNMLIYDGQRQKVTV